MAIEPPVTPDCGESSGYPTDPNFPVKCNIDYKQAYCCMTEDWQGSKTDSFVYCTGGNCIIGPPGCHMTFPQTNSSGQPMLKTALSGTTMSPWVRIAFQEYCDIFEDPDKTAKNILTMGNISQPFNDEKCMATIKAFQYGWGTVGQGNRCRITILDQKGSSFQQWVERMGINPEGDSTPIQGKYRMKVQFGWYTTGGSDSDICGQPATPIIDVNDEGILPISNPAQGFNSAFIICSPVMYFITDWINVHYENGKFIYELEGVDLLVRAQEQQLTKVFGRIGESGKQMYFTKACQLLGQLSFPPFRVEFKAIDATGKVVDLQFSERDGAANDRQCKNGSDCEHYDFDCEGYGPYDQWPTNTQPPLTTIREWMKKGVMAIDLTGKVTSNQGRVGITMNYDPTYKFTPGKTTDDPCVQCTSDIPNYGRLILWASGIPYCQGNFTDAQINERMKAVYIVNGGNCSPVLHFAPSFRWHSMAAQKAAGNSGPGTGQQFNQTAGAVKANCPIAATPGPTKIVTVVPTPEIMKVRDPSLQTMESTYHHIMTNLAIGAIEADLRVQGDPADWLCSPVDGYGRCVGIVFINPYFLIDRGGDCPVWVAGDPNSPDDDFKSVCNELLTSKGYFIMGADHQIKDGQYITTLKLKLLAPGAELNPATNPPTSLGGWDQATPLPYGGQFGCLNRNLVGNTGTGWGNVAVDCPVQWVGGGTPCSPNYITSSDLPPD